LDIQVPQQWNGSRARLRIPAYEPERSLPLRTRHRPYSASMQSGGNSIKKIATSAIKQGLSLMRVML
jgi:hypothetical protein